MASRMAKKAVKEAKEGKCNPEVLKQQLVDPVTQESCIVLVTTHHHMLDIEAQIIGAEEAALKLKATKAKE